MIKGIYQGRVWSYQHLLRKLQAECVSSDHFDANCPGNYVQQEVYHLSEQGVTLKFLNYESGELFIHAFGREDQLGGVEKVVLEEAEKHRTVEAKV